MGEVRTVYMILKNIDVNNARAQEYVVMVVQNINVKIAKGKVYVSTIE